MRDFSNPLFNYLDENKLLSAHQSGFRSNNSFANQLLAIVHETYTAFDANQTLETHGVYLEMPTTFGSVWCAWLIYKLKSVEVLGKTLKFIKTFLNSRFQSVLLYRWASDWLPFQAGVPQGSISGSLFFHIYNKDFPNNLVLFAKHFAGNNSLFSTVYEIDASKNGINEN